MITLLDAAAGAGGSGTLVMVVYFIAIFGFMYFFVLKPQKKQKKEHDQMLSELCNGDYVLTSSGMYGTVIDITDDMVIVEFGNNKNCRIPMQKSAIVEKESAK